MANSEVNVNSQHVQAKFHTKQLQYAVPDDAFFIPSSVTVDNLNTLINTKLASDSSDENRQNVDFDFLIDNEFLRVTLEEHLLSKGISLEAVIDIQYVKRDAAPEFGESLIHDDWVSAIRANENLILTGSYDGIARIWNTDGEMLIDTTQCSSHGGQPIKCVAWSYDDKQSAVKYFITGSHDEKLLIWEWMQRTNKVTCIAVCRGHARSVDSISVSPNKMQFCSGSWDTMLKMWSSEAGKEGVEDDNSEQEEQRPQKRKKSSSPKAPTRVPLMTLSGHTEGISSTEWIDETSICSASWDHSIRLWDLQQATTTSTISGNKAFFSVAYSQLNKTLVAASADRHIRLYDTRSSGGSEVKSTFSSHTAWVSCVAWSPKNEHQFISGSYDQLLKLWDTRCPRAPLFDMSEHDDKILAADWSTPQFMLSGGADNQLKIFKANGEHAFYSEL